VIALSQLTWFVILSGEKGALGNMIVSMTNPAEFETLGDGWHLRSCALSAFMDGFIESVTTLTNNISAVKS
jgi:hypothetical protein